MPSHFADNARVTSKLLNDLTTERIIHVDLVVAGTGVDKATASRLERREATSMEHMKNNNES
jgi:hypothetical protein